MGMNVINIDLAIRIIGQKYKKKQFAQKTSTFQRRYKLHAVWDHNETPQKVVISPVNWITISQECNKSKSQSCQRFDTHRKSTPCLYVCRVQVYWPGYIMFTVSGHYMWNVYYVPASVNSVKFQQRKCENIIVCHYVCQACCFSNIYQRPRAKLTIIS